MEIHPSEAIYTPLDFTLVEHNIKKLSTKFGIDYNKLTDVNYVKSPKKYKIPAETGELETEGLFKHKEIAVAMTDSSPNTKLEAHIHEELEIIKILEGEMHITIENEEPKILKINDVAIIPAYTAHSAVWPVHTRFIAITMPACDTWPDANI